jgi:hypothetical protein
MFYLTNTSEMQKRASEVAIYFVILGAVCLVSATLQFWGNAEVVGSNIKINV